VPIKGNQGLFGAGVLQPLLIFELGNGVVRQVQRPGDKTLVLAALPKAETGPRFITDWQGDVPAGKQAEVLVNGRRSVSDAPMIAGGIAAGGARVDVLAERGLPGAVETRVTAQTQGAGLLVFRERLDERQEILIDGKPAPRYVADAVWPAALVPAGDHEVVLRRKRSWSTCVLSAFVFLTVMLWALVGKAARRRMGVTNCGDFTSLRRP